MTRSAPVLEHPYAFDPTYGYDLERLLAVTAPAAPADFAEFWQETYRQSREVPLNLTKREVASPHADYRLFEVEYDSFGGLRIGGWLTVPKSGEMKGGWIVGHGYGGREAPHFDLPPPAGPALFFCARGFHRSAHPDVPAEAAWHVRHGIQSRETYVLRGCVADIWSSVSALLELFPETTGRVRYHGGSFGGGLGALALPWEPRFQKGFLDFPTFGNHPIRLSIPCAGSGESVRMYHQKHPEVTEVLAYYDAAIASTFCSIPVCVAAALFDPAVPPPGQFCVYNALAGPKILYVRTAAHFTAPGENEENAELHQMLTEFFHD